MLCSEIPAVQGRYAELQPAAVGLLCSLLRQSHAALAVAAAQQGQQGQLEEELGAALEALKTLRKAVSDPPAQPASAASTQLAQQRQQQQASTAVLLELLFGFAQCLDLAPPNAHAAPACQVGAAPPALL